MTPPDPEEVGRGLTEAQRRALIAFPGNGHYLECHERANIPHLQALRRRGLAEPNWSSNPRSKPWSITPLGVAVRALIVGGVG